MQEERPRIGEKTLIEIEAQVRELFNNHVSDIERAIKNSDGKVDIGFKSSLTAFYDGTVSIQTAIAFTAEKISDTVEKVTIMELQEELPGMERARKSA
ncbi:MAG: hypothetical protein LLG06_11325 [Desulfobacteraceae bacterium]|nr:hypothetical protein [Desulfobacteraceae bacterium]